MSELQDKFDNVVEDTLDKFSKIDPASDDAVRAAKVLETLSRSRPSNFVTPPEPIVAPERELTTWEKVRCHVATVLDNETTRVAIKALGAFGGVYFVTHATVKRDHVIERTALAQANQRPN